jgi:hypothetical protein
MVFLRKAFTSALLLTVALLGVATSTVEGSSHAVDESAFRPRSRMPLVDGDKKHSRSSARLVVDKEASLSSQKSLSVRGGVANTYPNAILGAMVFALIENGVKRGLKAADLNFPAQLASCIFLFAFLLLTEAVSPELANAMFSALTPGAGILAKWLPVFFVPALVMLPLSPSIGSSFEVRNKEINALTDCHIILYSANMQRNKMSHTRVLLLSLSHLNYRRFSRSSWWHPLDYFTPLQR